MSRASGRMPARDVPTRAAAPPVPAGPRIRSGAFRMEDSHPHSHRMQNGFRQACKRAGQAPFCRLLCVTKCQRAPLTFPVSFWEPRQAKRSQTPQALDPQKKRAELPLSEELRPLIAAGALVIAARNRSYKKPAGGLGFSDPALTEQPSQTSPAAISQDTPDDW